MFRQRSIWTLWLMLSAVSVACSSGSPSPQAVPPTATVPAQPTATATLTSVPYTLPPPVATETPTKSLPLAAPATPAATATQTLTVTQTPKPRLPVTTARPRATIAPLVVSYEVVEIKREPGEQATLVLKVNATGGGGSYRYFHDDIAQSGALFKVAGVCGKPFVHTIKVSAASGETVSLPYHVGGVCPTPTP